MPRSSVVPAFGLYGFAVVSAFALLWAYESTDDFAGWVPVTAVLAVPAVLELLADPPRARHRQVWTIALPAGVALGGVTIDVVVRFLRLGQKNRTMLDLLGIAIFGGLGLALGFTIVVWWYLLNKPLRAGAAKVLTLLALIGVGSLFLAPVWSECWLLGGLTLLWTAAPAIALTAEPRHTATPQR